MLWIRERTIPTEGPPLVREVPTFADRWCRVISATDPYGRNLGFLDRSRYFFFQVAPQSYSTRLSGHRSRRTALKDYSFTLPRAAHLGLGLSQTACLRTRPATCSGPLDRPLELPTAILVLLACLLRRLCDGQRAVVWQRACLHSFSLVTAVSAAFPFLASADMPQCV
jgi:hypothetical protein